MLPIFAPVLVLVVGLLVFQWTFLLRDGVDPHAGAADPPLDRKALRAALAHGEEETDSRAALSPRAFAVRGFAYITAFTLAVLVGAALYASGVVGSTIKPFGAGGPGIPVTVLLALVLILIGVLRRT